MITSNLYREILIKPAKVPCNRLSIVSGYATAAFAAAHLAALRRVNSRPTVRLLIGMFPNISLLRTNHLGFKQLSTTEYPIGFECRYVIKPPLVHTKAFSWYSNETPTLGYVGSANYTHNGFDGKTQCEAMVLVNAELIQAYFDGLWKDALDCREDEADVLVANCPDVLEVLKTRSGAPGNDILESARIELSLLQADGEMHTKSGLNWGNRGTRNRNEAYIPLPEAVGASGFFPALAQPFTMRTDDGIEPICVPAQNKKTGGTTPHALHTSLKNSLMGEYFRRRLNLSDGAFVTKQDLTNYGRTAITVYKYDEENYLMDFLFLFPIPILRSHL